MKIERTARFDNDYKGLRAEHKQQFKNVLPDFDAACDNYVAKSWRVHLTKVAEGVTDDQRQQGLGGGLVILLTRWPGHIRVRAS